MKILGIDPGIGRCGWGIVEMASGKWQVANYGCIETGSKLPIEKRLEIIHNEISKIIKTHSPDTLAIEELFFNTNSKTAFVVGQARGVVLLCASQKQIPVSIYTPLQVKMAITGYGRADKNQIGQMVKALLKLKEIPKPDDAADALAVCLTHAFSEKLSRLSK